MATNVQELILLEAIRAWSDRRSDQARKLAGEVRFDVVDEFLTALINDNKRRGRGTIAAELLSDLRLGLRDDYESAQCDVARITLDFPHELLRWISQNREGKFDFSGTEMIQIWAITALACLAREQAANPLRIEQDFLSQAFRFAHGVGLSQAISGDSAGPGEKGRTIKLTRLSDYRTIDKVSDEISRLLVPEFENVESRRVLYYVLVELLRNVVQHSRDPLGGIVAAQRMDKPGSDDTRKSVQVVVADNGIGIHLGLLGFHPELVYPEAALEKSLWPHVSGTFEEGETGSSQNAGMGLFFIAEFAKLTAGRLLIASRGATLELVGDHDGRENHDIKVQDDSGYPGTLVVFELPLEVVDHAALMDVVRQRAEARLPRRITKKWLRFSEPEPDVRRFAVSIATEDTVAAEDFAREQIIPSLMRREPVALDFRSISICTQSFLHALLFEAVRVSWALKVPIYVNNTAPAVQSNLELLEGYALSG